MNNYRLSTAADHDLAYLEHYTVEDYNRWEGDWELIEGAPYAMTPSPGVSHQSVASELFYQIRSQLDDCPHCKALYEIDVHLAQDTILRADIIVVCNQQGEIISQVPELVIEIVSESSRKRDEILK